MIIDKELEFSDSQALSATGGSTNTIDLGATNLLKDIGAGEPVYLVVQADVALAGTSPTLVIRLQTDDNTGFASATDLVTSPTFTSAPVGPVWAIALPSAAYERYVRAHYTLGGTTPTVTLSAFLTKDVQQWRAYADAL